MFRHLVIIGMIIVAGNASAASLPPAFSESQVVAGLNSPMSFTIAPDGRIFICEQTGKIRIVKNGALLAAPFLNIAVNSAGDRGMLGVVFDPNFAGNHFVYVLHTSSAAPYHNIVSRFTANGDIVASGSQVVLFHLSNFPGPAHNNAASIALGPDGKLYIASGDADTGANSQDMSLAFGKILRINTDGTIPTDNPFYETASGNMRAIWALGLRQPFTMNVDRSGRFFINDVGGALFEEINEAAAGANYGWPLSEGATSTPGETTPVHSYEHGPGITAITGGTLYNPVTPLFPNAYRGSYFFMDYGARWIRCIDLVNGNTVHDFASNIGGNPVCLRASDDGELFYLSRTANTLMKISYTPGDPPAVIAEPADAHVFDDDPAVFSVEVSGTAPLAFQWSENGVEIPGATTNTLAIDHAALADSGNIYSCCITNLYGSVTTRDAVLTVVQNQAPEVTFTEPAPGAHFIAGVEMTIRGGAVDPEDGELPDSALSWTIERIDGAGNATLLDALSAVAECAFTPPDTGVCDLDCCYRVTLTAIDTRGLSSSCSIDIRPALASLCVQTLPQSLSISVDGVSHAAPRELTTIAGFRHELTAASVQNAGADTFDLIGWSDGKAPKHWITAADSMVLTARYEKRVAPALTALAPPASDLTVETDAEFSIDASGKGPFTWRWDFGDGTSSSAAGIVRHSYATPGSYVLTVTVTDVHGLATTQTLAFTVKPKPVVHPSTPPVSSEDADGDGVWDAVELADGTDAFNPLSFRARTLTAVKLKALVVSNAQQRDSCTLSCVLPEVISAQNAVLLVNINGFSMPVQLNASGAGAGVKLKQTKASKSRPAATTLSLKLTRATLEGIVPDGGGSAFPVEIRISFAGKIFSARVQAGAKSSSGTTRFSIR